MKNPNRDICLVLISEDYDDRNTLQKKLKENTLFLDVRVPFPSKMKEWVNFIIKNKKYNVNPSVIENMIDSYGDSIAHVINEIEKMVLLIGIENELNDEVLSSHLSIQRKFHLWQFQDAIGGKNVDYSITIINSLIENGTKNSSNCYKSNEFISTDVMVSYGEHPSKWIYRIEQNYY